MEEGGGFILQVSFSPNEAVERLNNLLSPDQFRSGPDLVFDPVRQGDAGTYLCRARNNVSSSDELSVTFDVLFEPRNLRTEPAKLAQLTVEERAR